MRAFQGFTYSIDEIGIQLESDAIPFAYIAKRSERPQMKYKKTLTAADNLNKFGWKLCHINPIGLRNRTSLEELPIRQLTTHFQLLLNPSNHFLVPLSWQGLGEVPEMIDEIQQYELSRTLI